ncbi:FAD-dependent oxidoreductase [Candidatus Uhrbacteria bacterium]|nr:FAD-dependent oxidoreductase [Candidatus Uhrbacteria bacterium]
MPLPQILPYRVTRNEFVTEHVIQLECVSAEGVERPSFVAGQFMMLHWKDELGDLIDKPHAYSIASAPQEEGFIFSIKIYGPYTTRLSQEPKLGSIVHLQGPYGLFTLQKVQNERVVLLAGGVGIAPFRSMILDELTRIPIHSFHILYSNKTKSSFPFKEELDTLSLQHPKNLKVSYTITQDGDPDWTGHRGRWTAESIKKEIGDGGETTFFVCGPPPFVVEMQDQLAKMGVEKNKVKVEKFT